MASLLLVFAACEKEAEQVSIKFASQTYQMSVGQTMDLVEELVVENTDKKPSFSSSDSKVATVNRSGKVTALAQGSAVITAEVAGKSAVCTVQVSEVKAEKIVIDSPGSLPADETWVTLVAEVEPAGFNRENLVWPLNLQQIDVIHVFGASGL